jgi:hypothetical protein
LEIRIYTEDNKIVVENKVQLKKTQEISTKVGLENINLRYIHLLNEKVDIENNDKLFKVKLPVINEHHNH